MEPMLTNTGTTSEPMLIAIENENVDFAELLLENGVDNTILKKGIP
jgi:hypothetical protein